jgi:hypothetical protein
VRGASTFSPNEQCSHEAKIAIPAKKHIASSCESRLKHYIDISDAKILASMDRLFERPAHLGRGVPVLARHAVLIAWRFRGTIRSHHANVLAHKMHSRRTSAPQAASAGASLNLQRD